MYAYADCNLDGFGGRKITSGDTTQAVSEDVCSSHFQEVLIPLVYLHSQLH